MRGEGLLYGLAFLGILGAGAALLGPRSKAPPRHVPRPEAGGRPRAARPAVPSTPLADAPPPAERSLRVVVQGEGGHLRGPGPRVVGAQASLREAADGVAVDLVLGEREVAFGAVGHVWVRRRPETLMEGERIVLPVAAPAVLVRVRERDGAPAADVPVEVRPARPGPPRRTDAGGTVVLDDLSPGLVVVEVGGSERVAAPLRVLAGEDREARVVLEPAWTVQGRVEDGRGASVAGAAVEAFDAQGRRGAPTVSDAEGRFLWRGPLVPILCLSLAAPGRARLAVEVRPAAGSLRSDLGVLALAAEEVEVRGRVAGGAGRPGARVVIEPAVAALMRELFGAASVLDPPLTVPLAPDGSYVARGLSGEVPLRVSLRGAGLPEDAIVAPRAGDRLVRDFAPAAGETLRARIVDGPAGAPVAGLVVLVSPEPADGDLPGPADRPVVSDAEGRILLEGLAPGPWFLRAYPSARRSLLQRVELPAVGEAALALAPRLEDDARRVVGRVVDEQGRGLAGVTLRAAGVVAHSGADGAFALEGVESLAARVPLSYGYEPGAAATAGGDPRRFSAPGRQDVVPGAAPSTLILPSDQALEFRAVDALNDRPLAWLHVVARADDGRVFVDRAFPTQDGRVRLDGLPRVGLALTLLAPGRRLARVVANERVSAAVAGGVTARDLGELRLHRGLALEGVVTDPGGVALPGARVAALDEGWLEALRADPSQRRELLLRTTTTGADGAFVLDGLDPLKPAAVVVWAPGFAPTARRAVVAMAPETVRPSPRWDVPTSPAGAAALERLHARVDVRLRRGSRVSLLLTDEVTGEAVRGAIVDLESARNGSDYLDLVLRGVAGGQVASGAGWKAVSEHMLWESREEGAYAVGPVEPGEYQLLIEHPLYHPERRRIPVLDPGDAFSFEALEPEPGAVIDPRRPETLARMRPGPEMVALYGSDKMRLPIDLKPR